ncbi:MAG: hypothetical protein JXR26_04550 [Balneolaceae bacterium]|nr:hypothetical protein [Balneolaceae bacterium]
MKLNLLLSYIFIALLTGFTACSDNSSGAGGGEPPAIPDITAQTQPDVSFFEDNTTTQTAAKSLLEYYLTSDVNLQSFSTSLPTATTVANNDAYTEASITVLTSAIFSGFFPVFTNFVGDATQEDPVFNNGVWEWSYSLTEGGMSASLRLTAEEKNGSTEWNLYMTADNGEMSIEDANIISGTIQNDGSSGSWEFRFPNESNAIVLLFSSEWIISSDTENNIVFNVYNGDASPVIEIAFDTNEPEHLMTWDDVENTGSGTDVEVYWNTDSSIGYYFSADGDPSKRCWDSSLQNISCSDVGL